MNTKEAKTLGQQLAGLVESGQIDAAYGLLEPVLAERVRFSLLGHIGTAVGCQPLSTILPFLQQIAAGKTIGGWPIIGKALAEQWQHAPAETFAHCREFIIASDVWYGADILGERVPGPALVSDFETAFALLTPWSTDPNRWVRRTVGVSVHLWTKRSKGNPELAPRAAKLLNLLGSMFGEQEMDAVKGVGWGLKTLGRFYPDLLTKWLIEVAPHHRPHRALMLRKALTYLTDEQRATIKPSS